MRAVITGATGGIGGATAEALGRAGYEVIITGIDIEAGKKVIDKLESQGIKVHFYACDATNEEQVNETFAKIGEAAWAAGGVCPRWRPALCARSWL